MIIRQEHIPHPWPLWQDTAGSHSVPDWVVALTILSLLSNLAKSGLPRWSLRNICPAEFTRQD